MSVRSRIADEQTSSLGGWLFADLFLLIMVIGLASFSIDAVKGGPNATTGQAKNVSAKSAVITGIVDSGDDEAAAIFRWGTSSTLGSDAQVTKAVGSPIAAGEFGTDVSAQLDELKPKTKYFFQLIAESSVDKSLGEIRSFETNELDVGPCSNGPTFIKTPFRKRYTTSMARRALLSDLTRWTTDNRFVEPKVAVALVRGWTDNPAGSAGSSRARAFFEQVMIKSDLIHFDANSALEALQNQSLPRGSFDVQLFFVEDAEKCSE